MKEFRFFLRGSNFYARAFTFGMIPVFYRFFQIVGTWFDVSRSLDFRWLGAVGILFGSFIGHRLYYHWIFPEKNKSSTDIQN